MSPNSQGYNMTHMSSFVDQRLKPGIEIPIVYNQNTIYGILKSSGKFEKLCKIIEKSHLFARMNDRQADFTLLAPPDDKLTGIKPELIDEMDRGTATDIIKSMSLIRRLDSNVLKSSPVAYYPTDNRVQQLYVTNLVKDGEIVTRLNNRAKVIQFDVPCENGMIHVIDNLLVPDNEHYMN